jgi:hypothetical protein
LPAMATTESRGLRRRGRRPAAGLYTAARPATKREREADGAMKGRWPRRRREAEAAETTAAGRRAAGAAALTGASAAIETARRWRALCVYLLRSRRELALTKPLCLRREAVAGGGGEDFMRGSSCGR